MEESKAHPASADMKINTDQNEEDYEEGQLASGDENDTKDNHRFVSRLPAYCRVNPNLPISKEN